MLLNSSDSRLKTFDLGLNVNSWLTRHQKQEILRIQRIFFYNVLFKPCKRFKHHLLHVIVMIIVMPVAFAIFY
jgi:hypothetical protein